MVISDLNYVEVVSETENVEGGLRQTVGTGQGLNVGSGNNGRGGISIGNVALGLNINIPTIVGLEAFTVS